MKVIPIGGHPRQEALDAYVSDALDEAEVPALESHVMSCPHCEARLQAAARLEMVLFDVAEAFEAEPPALVPVPAAAVSGWGERLRKRVVGLGGLWAAAAALTLVLWQPHEDERPQPELVLVSADALGPLSGEEGQASTCPAGECGDLLASVDPLESIDPLSSWPDDPLVRSSFTDAEPLDGEPCGSGEDGGPLVCDTVAEPISG